MKKTYKLAEKITTEINDFYKNYVSDDSETIHTKESILALDSIIKDGFILYKYLVEKKLYENKPNIEATLIELQKYMSKLEINKENATNLDLSNALQLWNQTVIVIATLACNLLDYRDSLN